MKSEKGVTIVSLIIYIGILFVVVLLVGKATSFFYKNSNTITSGSSEADFNKVNLYILSETKKENNNIESLGKMSIDSNNIYSFSEIEEGEDASAIKFKGNNDVINVIGKVDNSIYYNKVKLCDNIDSFVITNSSSNGRIKLNIELKFNNSKTYSSEYTLKYGITN